MGEDDRIESSSRSQPPWIELDMNGMLGMTDADVPYDTACQIAKNLEPRYGGLVPRRADEPSFLSNAQTDPQRAPIALVPTPLVPFPLIKYWLPNNYQQGKQFVQWTINENRIYFPLAENYWVSAHALGTVLELAGNNLKVKPIGEWLRFYQYKGYIQIVWSTAGGYDYAVYAYDSATESPDGFVFTINTTPVVPPAAAHSITAGDYVFWVAKNSQLPAVTNLTASAPEQNTTNYVGYMISPQILRIKDSADYSDDPPPADERVVNPNRNRWVYDGVWSGISQLAVNSNQAGTIWSGISILDAATPKEWLDTLNNPTDLTTGFFEDPPAPNTWFENLKRNNIPMRGGTTNDWITMLSNTLAMQHPAGARDTTYRDSWVYRAVRYPPRWRLEPAPLYDRFAADPNGPDTGRWIFGPYLARDGYQAKYRPYLAMTGDVYNMSGEAWCHITTADIQYDNNPNDAKPMALMWPAYGFKLRKISDSEAWLTTRWVFKNSSDYALVVFRFLRPSNPNTITPRWDMSGNTPNAQHANLASRNFNGWVNEGQQRNDPSTGLIGTINNRLVYRNGLADGVTASFIDANVGEGLVLTIPEIVYIGSGLPNPTDALSIGALKAISDGASYYVPADLKEDDIVWGTIESVRKTESVYIAGNTGLAQRRYEPAEQQLPCYKHVLKGVRVRFPKLAGTIFCGLVFQCETRGLNGIGSDGRYYEAPADWNWIFRGDSKPSWYHAPGKDHRQHATPYTTFALRINRVTASDTNLGSAYFRKWCLRFDFEPAGDISPYKSLVAYLERGETPGKWITPLSLDSFDQTAATVSFTLPNAGLTSEDRAVIAVARGGEWVIVSREPLGSQTTGTLRKVVNFNTSLGLANFCDEPLPYGKIRAENARLVVASRSTIWISGIKEGLSFTRYPADPTDGFAIPIPEYDSELANIDSRIVVLAPQRAYALVLDTPQNSRLVGVSTALNYVRPGQIQRLQPVAGTLTLTEFGIHDAGKLVMFTPRWNDLAPDTILALCLAWNGQIPYLIVERPSEYEIYFAPGNPTGWLLWTVPKTTESPPINDTNPRLTHYEFIDGYLVLVGNKIVRRNGTDYHVVFVGTKQERINPQDDYHKAVYKTGAIYLQQGVRTKKAGVVINDMPGRVPNNPAVVFKQYKNAEDATPHSTNTIYNRETFPLKLNGRKNEALIYEMEWLDALAVVDKIMVYPVVGLKW